MIGKEQTDILTAKNIELICFAQYSAYIHFENEITLTVQAGFEYTHDGKSEIQQASLPYSRSSLMSILENNVTSAKINSNGDFNSRFQTETNCACLKKLRLSLTA
jgi:hypothetical protein